MAIPGGSPAALPLPQETPLVGRDRELATLREHLAAARAGRGSLVLIGGEAGIGKTALAEALGREAVAQGALLLVGRGYDLTETPPYGPWRELFDRSPRAVGRSPLPAVLARGAVHGVASQPALFAQVRDSLAALAARQPLVLLLDDLHWADPASLELLRALARRLAPLPLLLIGTYRAEAVDRDHPLYALLPTLVREAHTARLDLRRLDDDAVRALVRARYPLREVDEARLVAFLRDRAEGNPFFVGELLRTLVEERLLAAAGEGWTLGDVSQVRLPTLLRQVIDGRLVRLGEQAQHLLAVGAVIGQEVPLALWGAVAEVAEGPLLEVVARAVAAHLLEATPDGARVRFVHALIRQALYEGLLPSLLPAHRQG